MGPGTYFERFISWTAYQIARLMPWPIVEACFFEAIPHQPEEPVGDLTVMQIMDRW